MPNSRCVLEHFQSLFMHMAAVIQTGLQAASFFSMSHNEDDADQQELRQKTAVPSDAFGCSCFLLWLACCYARLPGHIPLKHMAALILKGLQAISFFAMSHHEDDAKQQVPTLEKAVYPFLHSVGACLHLLHVLQPAWLWRKMVCC